MLVVITDRRETGKQLASMLMNEGIFSFECPPETGAFYCEKKDTGGVLLDCCPDLKSGERLCRELRRTYPKMPILALVPQDSVPDLEADSILRDAPLSLLFPVILDFCRETCGWTSAPLSTYFLTVGATSDEVLYMGYPMPLPQKSYIILKCLFYRYPKLTSKEDLLSLCYPGGTEQAGNLAVQIHRINQCAAKIDPRPLIVNIYGKGYKLRDGIL